MPKRGVSALGVLLVLNGAVLAGSLLAGCATYRAIPLDGGDPAHARPYRQELHGVTIAADLVAEPAETRALFYRDLGEQGVVPVIVHLQNQGERSVVIHRERIMVRLENGQVYSPLDPEEVIASCRSSRFWAYLGLPLIAPYFMVSSRVNEFNFELDQDYRQKCLPGFLRLAPGDPPMARALFFRLDEDSFEVLDRSPSVEVPAEVEALEVGERKPGEDVRFLLSLD